MMTSVLRKLAIFGAVFVAVFALGYWTASQRYEKEIAEGMLSAQKAAQAIERSRNEKIVGAMNERIEMLQNEADAARVERDDARRIADRLRGQSTARVPEGRGDSCRNDREENARLRDLLAEAVELLQEGRELYRGSAGAHDALADAVR